MSQVSVIMPCRNAEPYLGTALRSVLAQEGLLEVVLVDDGSTDRSVAIALGLQDARIRVVPGPGMGIAAAFNAGLQACRGDVIARCDADDAYPPGRLAWQAAWLASHPEFVAVCGPFMTVDSQGHELAQFEFGNRDEEITGELLQGRARTHFCTFACRADALRAIGGCRTWFCTAEDLDLQFRLARAGRVGFVPRLAYRYRIHDTSITHQQFDEQRDFYWKSAQAFALQRAAGTLDALEAGNAPQPPSGSGRRSAHGHAQGLLLGNAWRQHAAGRRWRSLVTGARAVAAGPRNLGVWRSMAVLVLHALRPWPAAAVTGQGTKAASEHSAVRPG